MPFQQGNQLQSTDNSKLGRRLLTKTRFALDKAIDGLGSAEKDGSTAMAELITEALRKDVVGTLKALSGYMPKEVNVDMTHTVNPALMSDEQLLSIIESRQDKPKVINKLPVEANKVDD